jgi:hypothetical protein
MMIRMKRFSGSTDRHSNKSTGYGWILQRADSAVYDRRERHGSDTRFICHCLHVRKENQIFDSNSRVSEEHENQAVWLFCRFSRWTTRRAQWARLFGT